MKTSVEDFPVGSYLKLERLENKVVKTIDKREVDGEDWYKVKDRNGAEFEVRMFEKADYVEPSDLMKDQAWRNDIKADLVKGVDIAIKMNLTGDRKRNWRVAFKKELKSLGLKMKDLGLEKGKLKDLGFGNGMSI